AVGARGVAELPDYRRLERLAEVRVRRQRRRRAPGEAHLGRDPRERARAGDHGEELVLLAEADIVVPHPGGERDVAVQRELVERIHAHGGRSLVKYREGAPGTRRAGAPGGRRLDRRVLEVDAGGEAIAERARAARREEAH